MPKAKDPIRESAAAPNRDADKFNVRLAEGMRDRIAKAAQASGRSMNAEIVHRLEQSLLRTGEDSGQPHTLLHWLFLRARRLDAQAELDLLNQRPTSAATAADIVRAKEQLLAVRRLMGALETQPAFAQALQPAADPAPETRAAPRGGTRKKGR